MKWILFDFSEEALLVWKTSKVKMSVWRDTIDPYPVKTPCGFVNAGFVIARCESPLTKSENEYLYSGSRGKPGRESTHVTLYRPGEPVGCAALQGASGFLLERPTATRCIVLPGRPNCGKSIFIAGLVISFACDSCPTDLPSSSRCAQPWQRLNFLPLPQGHGSFLPTLFLILVCCSS